MSNTAATNGHNPLLSLDEWEEDVLQRYPDPDSIATNKTTEEYRNYDEPARDTVKEFYRLNHTYQTYDFVQQKKAEYLKFSFYLVSISKKIFDIIFILKN